METKTPFSQEALNEIFKISSADPERVISRETSSLEFKESFGWTSLPKYLKTSASYANAKGGYIVFGIANKPHRLCGLSGANLKLFEVITTIHKFGEADGRLNERSNIIVMVDEAHRTQEGDMGRKMRDALSPDPCLGLYEKD